MCVKVEFIMHTDKYVEVKLYEEHGIKRFLGWSLPTEVVEELVKWWQEKGRALSAELKKIENEKTRKRENETAHSATKS